MYKRQPTFTLASKKSSCLVVEASSFMLHYTYKTKPHVMVIPNIIKHHIDYHKTYNSYIKDKLKIIRNMNHYDYVVYNKEDVILDEIISKISLSLIHILKYLAVTNMLVLALLLP